jgi:hypothetical protein
MSLTTLALQFSMTIAPSAQDRTHSPHPVHFSSSILMIFRFTLGMADVP